MGTLPPLLLDLTDFTEAVHIYGDASPSLAHLLGAWSLHSGIVLDVSRSFTARMINSTGGTVTLPINLYTSLDILANKGNGT